MHRANRMLRVRSVTMCVERRVLDAPILEKPDWLLINQLKFTSGEAKCANCHLYRYRPLK